MKLRFDGLFEVRLIVFDLEEIVSSLIHDLLVTYGRYIRQETLSTDLVHVVDSELPGHLEQVSFELDGKQVTVAVSKK